MENGNSSQVIDFRKAFKVDTEGINREKTYRPAEEDDPQSAAYSVRYYACIKIILIIFNFLLWCAGMTFMGIGIWFRVDPKMYEPTLYIETENFINVGWIMMFTGLAIVIITIIGCIGVITNSTCKIGFYIFIMVLLIVMAIAGLVLSTTHGFGDRNLSSSSDILNHAHRSMNQQMIDNFAIQSSEGKFSLKLETYVTQQLLLHIQQRQFNERSKEVIDFIQVKLKCCGAVNFNDFHRYGLEVPVSCSREFTNFVNQEGCGRVLSRFYDLRGGVAVGLFGIAAIFEFICIITAISLFCAIRYAAELED